MDFFMNALMPCISDTGIKLTCLQFQNLRPK